MRLVFVQYAIQKVFFRVENGAKAAGEGEKRCCGLDEMTDKRFVLSAYLAKNESDKMKLSPFLGESSKNLFEKLLCKM